jgi:hypothetical protein
MKDLKKITWPALLAMFDPQAHAGLESARRLAGVSHILVYQNRDLSDRQVGNVKALAVGPGRTYKTVEELLGKPCPSNFESCRDFSYYPEAVCEVAL